MNVAERLVQLSGLPSGSALAHFAAITQTGGTGPGSLLLVSKAAIQISYPEHRYHKAIGTEQLVDIGAPNTPLAFVIAHQQNEIVITTKSCESISVTHEELSVISRTA